RGFNGGGGLAAARHLLNWGAWVQTVLTDLASAYTGSAAQQLQSLQAMAAPLAWAEEGWELPPADHVIDALIGCELQGVPHGATRDLIQLANSSVAPILSLDVPSGVDATTGECMTPHIRAAATMTLALPKRGLLQPAAQSAMGDLYLADSGVPPALFAQLGLDLPPLFAAETILPLSAHAGTVSVMGMDG
ncbi:MAG: NAD(P)H-hydrate epimerase, partial [Caldilineaceae bacterium]|nr:NAD(P)H-hydrate epimerase [Caldilineaceae bacterium]